MNGGRLMQRLIAGGCGEDLALFCALVSGEPAEYRANNVMIYQDEEVLVFLNRYPTLRGYTLVCPRRHLERVVADFSADEYMRLQHWVYRVGRAIEAAVPTERLYVMSLGSQQGNRHVHWHLAPLPPGVPYEEQQLAAVSLRRGVLDLSREEMQRIADDIRSHLATN